MTDRIEYRVYTQEPDPEHTVTFAAEGQGVADQYAEGVLESAAAAAVAYLEGVLPETTVRAYRRVTSTATTQIAP